MCRGVFALALAVGTGRQVMKTLMAGDVTVVCGKTAVDIPATGSAACSTSWQPVFES